MGNEHPKIKLIFPCIFEVNDPLSFITEINLPYGMGVLASFLKKQNLHVEMDDLAIIFNHRAVLPHRISRSELQFHEFDEDISAFFQKKQLSHRLDNLLRKILGSISINQFDIIGFSIFTYEHFLSALLLSHKIKEAVDTPIVFGGPFISQYGPLYPDAFKYIDFMIAGDGGAPLSQLVHSLDQKSSLEHIPGLIYINNGHLTVVPKAKGSIEDMPVPDFSGLPLDLYRTKSFRKNLRIPYQISRGCDGTCSFCNKDTLGSILEYKSYHKVMTELRNLKEKYGSNLFYFCDSGAINNSYEYLEGLCAGFIDHKINIRWSAYARIKQLDREILKKMKRAGCLSLHFGVESGSDRMLRLMNKGVTAAQTQSALRDAARLGIKNFVFFISGYPFENEKDVKDTVHFIKRNKKYLWLAHVYILAVRYGSHLWKHHAKHGIHNLVSIEPLRYIFAFDEMDGLRWQEKSIQQKESRQKIIKAVRKYLGVRMFCFTLFQEVIYFLIFKASVLLRAKSSME